MKKKQKVCKAAEQVKEVVQNTMLQVGAYFPCPVYIIERPDFLESVTVVSEESMSQVNKDRVLDEIYPVMMSGNYMNDQRIQPFIQFVLDTAWNILSEQGYAMQNYVTTFTEMWTQEHHKHSAMEQHTHPNSQIVGFYFLDVPEDSSRVLFHDPRIAKTMSDLPEQDVNNATIASKIINFVPKPGMLMFANAWVAHSFSRHASDKPIKFVHFNIATRVSQQTRVCAPAAAEII